MRRRLNIASSPHWRRGDGLERDHLLWAVALLPVVAASLWIFGWPVVRILGLSIAVAVGLDALVERLAPSKDPTSNGSSLVMGLLLGLMMPVDAPWWLVLVGAALMILVGKKLFGGVGAYPVHPALLSYAMISLSWPDRFDHTRALIHRDLASTMIEPIRLVKTLGAEAAARYPLGELLTGHQVAALGTGMVLWALAGGLLLLLLRAIPWQIPVAFLLGHAGMAAVLHWSDPTAYASPIFYLLAGGTVFAAFFLMPAPTTSPVNPVPMFLYGLLGGVLLMLIRAWSGHIDGIAFAVLLTNLCNPLLDRIVPRVKGVEVSHA